MPRHSSGKKRAGASSRAPYPSPTLSTGSGRKGKASASGSPGKPKRATADRLLSLAGKLPPYNDWQGAAVDDASHYMYIFGGCPPPVATEELAPSSHLFRLDLKKSPMDWVDFTTRLRPLGHFASATEIPPRLGSGVAFFRHDMRPYLIIFGGWGSGQLRSEFITVDLVDLTWELHSEVSDGILRVEPAVTVVDDRVCVFGGRSGETFQNGPAESSFCVIRMNAQTRRWEWEKKDAPVPVPALDAPQGKLRWNQRSSIMTSIETAGVQSRSTATCPP
ncbi:hypothetical protein EXIGLDRAFT_507254 [Exidia glandulosa HHB12029]|uniref:Galactose oxidase n=1 Tax=Exidia glandulosa HHB12029 TaxID=1314781 RepID=A0A165PBI7_EXIGL|nr:hypothetical protein EXIGLDRAFT_507254 [Exidia glandulosa HHB12029]